MLGILLRKRNSKNKRIYMDHAAATPVDDQVISAMQPYYQKYFHNPSALGKESVQIAQDIENARETFAAELGCRPREVVFTHGGTESNNLAILGVVRAFQEEQRTKHQSSQNEGKTLPHIIISAIEHSSVREVCYNLRDRGEIELDELPIDQQGIVMVSALKKLLKDTTILVSIMYVNNEIGTIQPIREITKTVRWFKKQKVANAIVVSNTYPLVHSDAIQAVNYCDVNVQRLGLDLMTMSGAKIYGPKGTALLYMKNGIPFSSIMYGGAQEFGIRPGTPNVPAIIGFAKAFDIATKMKEKEVFRLEKLQKYFFEKINKTNKETGNRIIINGDLKQRIPNNINISIPETSGEQLVIELDARGVICGAQSACNAHSNEESYVVEALYPDADIEAGSLRLSLGRSTQKADIDYVSEQLKATLKKIMATKARFQQ